MPEYENNLSYLMNLSEMSDFIIRNFQGRTKFAENYVYLQFFLQGILLCLQNNAAISFRQSYLIILNKVSTFVITY